MSWKSFVAGYLTFSKRDRAGLLVLLLLLALAFLLPLLAPTSKEVPVALDAATQQDADSLQALSRKNPNFTEDYPSFAFDRKGEANRISTGVLFDFDPNTLDDAGWRRLGLRDKTIRTLNNYRSKGGRFYKTEDLAKIWGLPPGFYDRVKGNIRIAHAAKKEERTFTSPTAAFVKTTPKELDINTADTTEFIALPGIGSKLAARIVNFREKLGGFSSVEQLGETYGLPDSTFQKIKGRLVLETGTIQQININTATKETLSAHPYINWKLASAIVAYREQHGAFSSADDLRKIMILDDATFRKLKPYLGL